MEFIDEHPVVGYRVRFQNRVEISEEQAPLVRDDMVVVWLVRSRCRPPQYHPTKPDAEERYRFNIQAVTEAVPLAGAQRDQAIAFIEHGGAQGYLDLDVPRFKQEQAFDPENYGPHAFEYQVAELARYLAEIGELDVDETAVENVRRVVENLKAETQKVIDSHRPMPDPLQRPYQMEALPVAAPPPADVPMPGDVEVVGSLWPNGRRPASRALIEEMFGR